MKKGFSFWIGHLTVLVLVAGMVVALPFTIAARDLGAVLFSPERIQSILESFLVQTGTLNRILADTLFDGRSMPAGTGWYKRATEHLSGPERQELLQLLVPPGWLDEQIGGLTGSLFDWLESDQVVPELYIDVQPIKARLLGESLDQAVEVFVDSWPSCTPEEVEQLQRALDGGGELPEFVCEPPEPIRGVVVDLATRALAEETSALPDRVPLLGRGEVNLEELRYSKQNLRRIRILLAWSWLIPLAALGPIMAIKVRGKEDLGRWWGLPVFFTGCAAILLSFFLRAARNEIFSDLLNQVGSPDSFQYELVSVIGQNVLNQALRLFLVHSVIILIAGAGFWFLLTRTLSGKSQSTGDAHGSLNRAEEKLPEAESWDPGGPPPVPPLESEMNDDQSEGPPSGIFG